MADRNRSFHLTKEERNGGILWNFHLIRADILLPEELEKIEEELGELSTKHDLPPKGGLYKVKMLSGGSHLGGIYVQDDKLNEVMKDLRKLGYSVSRKVS